MPASQLSGPERCAFEVIEEQDSRRRLVFARFILSTPEDAQDIDGNPAYDDKDRTWAKLVIAESFRSYVYREHEH